MTVGNKFTAYSRTDKSGSASYKYFHFGGFMLALKANVIYTDDTERLLDLFIQDYPYCIQIFFDYDVPVKFPLHLFTSGNPHFFLGLMTESDKSLSGLYQIFRILRRNQKSRDSVIYSLLAPRTAGRDYRSSGGSAFKNHVRHSFRVKGWMYQAVGFSDKWTHILLFAMIDYYTCIDQFINTLRIILFACP